MQTLSNLDYMSAETNSSSSFSDEEKVDFSIIKPKNEDSANSAIKNLARQLAEAIYANST